MLYRSGGWEPRNLFVLHSNPASLWGRATKMPVIRPMRQEYSAASRPAIFGSVAISLGIA